MVYVQIYTVEQGCTIFLVSGLLIRSRASSFFSALISDLIILSRLGSDLLSRLSTRLSSLISSRLSSHLISALISIGSHLGYALVWLHATGVRE